MPTQRKIWFITGASAGFGLTMTEYVLAQGHIAVATLRKPEVLSHLTEKYPADQLLLLKVDVSKKTDVVEAFAAVKEKLGRIDVVFNNAGYAFVAEVEDDVDDKARAVFDVNFWGATNVLKESVKFLRDVNQPRGGRIVTTSAIVGTTGHPSMGYYGATKHALEGIIKALSNEVLPEWNIKFNIIESGGFSTRIASPASYVMEPTLAAYKGGPSEVLRYYLENVDKMPVAGDPREAIRGIYAAASDEDAPLRIPLGVDALRAVKTELEAHLADVEKSRKYSESFKYEEGGNPFLKADQ